MRLKRCSFLSQCNNTFSSFSDGHLIAKDRRLYIHTEHTEHTTRRTEQETVLCTYTQNIQHVGQNRRHYCVHTHRTHNMSDRTAGCTYTQNTQHVGQNRRQYCVLAPRTHNMSERTGDSTVYIHTEHTCLTEQQAVHTPRTHMSNRA